MPDRRRILLGAALVPLSGAAFAQNKAARRQRRRAIILIHDAWHGGWCWRHVAQGLRASGHPTYTPTLTGVGERAHLRAPQIGLSTHIADIAAVIECEELDDAVLVGHGYAGVVVGGVADRMAERIAHVVLLDGVVPKGGQSMWDLFPPELSDAQSRNLVEGYLVKPPAPSALGVPDSDAANTQWLARRLTPHPAACFTEPLALKNGGAAAVPRTFIDCARPSIYGAEDPFARAARSEPGWSVVTIDSGHDAMITAPDALARIILDIA